MNKIIYLSLALLTLTGCNGVFGRSDKMPEPVGIGFEVDELKRSPCACIEIPQNWSRS